MRWHGSLLGHIEVLPLFDLPILLLAIQGRNILIVIENSYKGISLATCQTCHLHIVCLIMALLSPMMTVCRYCS